MAISGFRPPRIPGAHPTRIRVPSHQRPRMTTAGLGSGFSKAIGGGSGLPSTATPSAPGAPVFDPNTDPTYLSQTGNENASLQTTLGGLLNQLTSGLTSYGYKATFDPNDPFKVASLAYDPNNPYSKASLLRQSYTNAQRKNTNSYAAAGQLYAGSLNNAQDISTNNFNVGNDAIMKAVNNLISGIGNQAQTARNTAAADIGGFAGDALGRFTQAHAGDPAVPGTAVPGGPPPAQAPAKPGRAPARRSYGFGPMVRNYERRFR